MKAKLEMTMAIWLPASSRVPTHPIMMPARAKAQPSMNICRAMGEPTRMSERIVSHEKLSRRKSRK